MIELLLNYSLENRNSSVIFLTSFLYSLIIFCSFAVNFLLMKKETENLQIIHFLFCGNSYQINPVSDIKKNPFCKNGKKTKFINQLNGFDIIS